MKAVKEWLWVFFGTLAIGCVVWGLIAFVFGTWPNA